MSFRVSGKMGLRDEWRGEVWSRGGKARIKNRVAHEGVAGLVVLVPTSAPMSNDDGWLELPDAVRDGKARLVREGNFGVGIRKEVRLGAQNRGGLFRGLALHGAVFRRWDGGGPALAKREAEENPPAALRDFSRDRRAHGEQRVARMGSN